MVQKKAENKVGNRAEMKNSIKLDRRTAGKSPLYEEMIARPSQSIRGGGELKKKLRRSRSLKLADWRSIGSPPKQDEDAKKKQTATRMEDRSPNYMKPTSSSDKRKENVQVSTQTQTSNRIQRARDSNYTRKKPDARGSKSTTASASKNVKQLTRSSSLKPIKPSMKATGLPLFSLQDIARSTCSSTIKDSKFPDYLDLHPGGTESEGTSIFKVCPYTYCSLNGHFHKPLPPLKHFISARRRLLKTQKSVKMKGSIPRRIKNAKEVKKKIDTGQNLVPVRSEEVFRTDMISSPRWPHSWNEEQSELLTGDWSDEFFLEIFPDWAPDLTDVESFGKCGNMEICSDDEVAEPTNEEDDAKKLSESVVVSCEKIASESEQDCVKAEETVSSRAHYEKNVSLEAEDGGNHEDRIDDSCLRDADTAAALSGASQSIDCNVALDQLSDENGSFFPEEDVTSEACGGSESDEVGLRSDTITEMEEDDEASLYDETSGSSFTDGEPEHASTPLVREAVLIYDEPDSNPFSNSTPLDFCDQTGNPLPEDSSEAIENVEIDDPAAQGDEIVIMEEDQAELIEFVELYPIELDLIASEVLEVNFPADQTDEIGTTKEEVYTEFIDFCPNVDILAAEKNEITIPKEEVQTEVMGSLHPTELEPVINESLDDNFPTSQGDEINHTNEQVQTEATAPVVQTETTVIVVELYTTEQEAMDYEDDIPNPDNRLVEGDEAFVVAEGSCELKDDHDAKEALVDVQVASDGQGCSDVQTMVEAVPDYSEDDLVADETTFPVTQNSDLAVQDVAEEIQIKVIEHPDDLETENCPPPLLVPEAKDETVTGDSNLNVIQKDIEFVQLDIVKDQNHQDATGGKHFQVESRDEVPDEENCTAKLAEIQSLGSSDSQCPCNVSSGESGDQNKPTSVDDCSKDGLQMNCDTEQQEESVWSPPKAESHFIIEKSSNTGIDGSPSNQSEVSNFESNDDIGSMNKDEKVMRPVMNAIQPPVSNYSGLKYRANPKRKVENVNEERMFNPRGPSFLPIEPDPDAEKVDLRHQMMDERKNSEEWMLDYALRQAVNKLAPARRKKVALLVEAFETVMPLPKCETRVHHSAMSFTHARTIQACS
ncbi:calmodulin binding protein PICBP [Nymphaea colorata]|uniref:Calmodulin-binding domain-containing protein n=1 Tax=Nymphaea colorata TaxID=210225 RepID=A0A5K0WGK2_9MAGN|nr:calmodulin binding protein PICBP [Nymphaea colorata]